MWETYELFNLNAPAWCRVGSQILANKGIILLIVNDHEQSMVVGGGGGSRYAFQFSLLGLTKKMLPILFSLDWFIVLVFVFLCFFVCI